MAMNDFEKKLAWGAAGGGGMFGMMGGDAGLWGKPEQVTQHDLYTPQGKGSLDWLMNQGQQNMDFNNIRQNEINRFNTQTVPGLAERFTSMGGSGQRSSGFQDALGRAGAGLGSDLASMQSQFGMQQMGMGLRPQFENIFRPRQKGGVETGMENIMQLLPLLMML